MRIRSTSCCGMKEMYGIADGGHDPRTYVSIPPDPKAQVLWFGRHRTATRRLPFIVFSGVEAYNYQNTNSSMLKYASRLARFITRHRLGKVAKSIVALNPNSSNLIQAFIWAPDYTNLAAFVERENARGTENRRRR